MPGPFPALSAERLSSRSDGAGVDWETVSVIASTQVELLGRARLRAPSRPVVLAADEQTAGHGRQGRDWVGMPGEALLFSVALPWERPPAESAAVTLACGVAVAERLERSGVAVQVKWPNDLLLDGRKLAGILAELTEDASGARTLVIGMGMNLLLGEAQRRRIGQPAAHLAERLGAERAAGDREAWLAILALAIIEAGRRYQETGFAAFRTRFERLCAYAGCTVEIRERGNVRHRGRLCGVDDDGRLLLDCGAGAIPILSGDLSLRESPDRACAQAAAEGSMP